MIVCDIVFPVSRTPNGCGEHYPVALLGGNDYDGADMTPGKSEVINKAIQDIGIVVNIDKD